MGTQLYQQVLEEYKGKLQPAWHSDSKMVHRVLNRLIPASGLQDAKWEVNVIDDDSQMNAFVIPGYALESSFTLSGKPLLFVAPADQS